MARPVRTPQPTVDQVSISPETGEGSLPNDEVSLSSPARTGPAASITPATRPTATIDLHPFIRPPREPLLPRETSSPKRETALLGSDDRLGRQELEQIDRKST